MGEEVNALAVALVCPKRAGVELGVVGGVVAVDVGVFEDVGLRADDAEVSNRVPDYLKAGAAEQASETAPKRPGCRVERWFGLFSLFAETRQVRLRGLDGGGSVSAMRTRGPSPQP